MIREHSSLIESRVYNQNGRPFENHRCHAERRMFHWRLFCPVPRWQDGAESLGIESASCLWNHCQLEQVKITFICQVKNFAPALTAVIFSPNKFLLFAANLTYFLPFKPLLNFCQNVFFRFLTKFREIFSRNKKEQHKPASKTGLKNWPQKLASNEKPQK